MFYHVITKFVRLVQKFVTWRALNVWRVIEFSLMILSDWIRNRPLAIFIWIQMLREVRFMCGVKQWHLQSELYAWRHLGVVGNLNCAPLRDTSARRLYFRLVASLVWFTFCLFVGITLAKVPMEMLGRFFWRPVYNKYIICKFGWLVDTQLRRNE